MALWGVCTAGLPAAGKSAYDNGIVVRGDLGEAHWTPMTSQTLVVRSGANEWTGSPERKFDYTYPPGPPGYAATEWMFNMYQRFIDDVREDREPQVPIEVALHVLQAIDATYESARTGAAGRGQVRRLGRMNVFFVVILAAVIVEFAVDVVSNLLNLAALKPDAPEGLQDVYEPDEYRRSQEYTRVTTRFGLVTSTFKLALFLAFWLLGGFNALDLWVRDLDVHVVVEGLVYLGVRSPPTAL